jgi:4-hydroxybenzoate polyprenyltransferase
VQALQPTLRAGELSRRGQLHARMRKEQSLLLDATAELSHRLPHAAMPRGRLQRSGDHAVLHCRRRANHNAPHMPAAVRLIHPAPALAVTLLSAVLGAILLAQEGRPIDGRWWLTVLAVAGSQVFTGSTNDLADAARDHAAGRTEKPIPAGEVSQNLALWLASVGLAVQVAASGWLGALPLALGLGAVASAAAYNLALSRTPVSPLPYLISFGLLPLWVAAGVDVPMERVIPAVPLAAAFATAAHLANTLRDFDSDAAAGSRCLAQVLGRGTTQALAIGLALAAGLGVGVALVAGGRASPGSLALGVVGLASVGLGALGERWLWYGLLVAAMAWTAAWAISTG